MSEDHLHQHYRGPDSQIRHLYGDANIGALRKIYGKDFALSFHFKAKLKYSLKLLDLNSLRELIRDHEAGKLSLLLDPSDVEMKSMRAVGIQYAALPYRICGRKVEVLLINSTDNFLVIPKSWPIRGVNPPTALAMGTTEEIGLVGDPETAPVGSYQFQQIDKGGESFKVQAIVFPFRVFGEAPNFSKASKHEMRWHPYKKAASRVAEPTLQRLIREFGKTRTPGLETYLRGLRLAGVRHVNAH